MTRGARFGPRAIRIASERQSPHRSFGPRLGLNPYNNWAKLVNPDRCLAYITGRLWRYSGDPIVIASNDLAYDSDNALAVRQIQAAYETLLSRDVETPSTSIPKTLSGRVHPRLLTLGGDHSIVVVSGFTVDLLDASGTKSVEQAIWPLISCSL